MAKKDKTIKEYFWQNSLWFIGLAMAIINLWLASKLSPLAEGIRILQITVQATENRVEKNEGRFERILWEIGELKKNCASK